MNRRTLLRTLCAIPFVPLAPLVRMALSPEVKDAGNVSQRLDEIMKTTMNSRSRMIADNIFKNRELLNRLRLEHAK